MRFGDHASGKELDELDETRRIWEEAFDEPYERPGALFNPMSSPSRVFINWEASEADVNRVYKGLHPRFLLEVSCNFSACCLSTYFFVCTSLVLFCTFLLEFLHVNYSSSPYK